MKTKVLCIAMALCLTVGLCACSAEDGRIRDNSEAHSTPAPRTAGETTNSSADRSYDSGNTADHHGDTAMNKNDTAKTDNTTNNQGVTDKNGEGRGLITDVGDTAKDIGRDIKNGAENLGRDVRDTVTENSSARSSYGTSAGSSTKGGS